MDKHKETLKYFLRKAFDLREGEHRRAILMQLNIFLIISTLLIVKPTANALFLSEIGVARLPLVFVLVAVFAALISSLYSRLLGRIPLQRIIYYTLALSVFCLLAFGILLRLNLLNGSILYLFYIWVAIFALLSSSQFWILANMVFNAREAKRLFGFIGAGAIAGGIFGGYLTSLLAPWLGSESLLFVGAFLLSFCLPITRYIWRKNVLTTRNAFQRKAKAKDTAKHPLRIILQSRHLTFLAVIIGIGVLVAKLVDYQFSAIAAGHITDPDELTAFFGFWFSNLNLVSLLIQLFITSRVVSLFGVGVSLFFLPAGIATGATILLFLPELWAAVLLKISEGSLKQSINRAALELLALPVPLEIKNRTKTFIDVSVDSIATGLGGLMLIFLVNGLALSTPMISVLVLVLLCIWFYFANELRGEYLEAFKLKIRQEQPLNGKKIPKLSQESVFGKLKKILESGEERQILYVLRKIRELNDDRFFEHIRQLLQHPSAEVRVEALRNLYFYRNKTLHKEVEELSKDPDQRVKIQAFEYLIRHAEEHVPELMNTYLQENDPQVSGAALVSLALESRDNPALKTAFDLEARLTRRWKWLAAIKDEEALRMNKINLIKATGHANIPHLYHRITASFNDSDEAVVKQAILSAGYTHSPEFMDDLLLFLAVRPYRKAARAALRYYGRDVVDLLVGKMQDGPIPVESMRGIPEALEKINAQKVVDFLFALLDYEDVSVRLQALRSLNTLKINYPYLKFSKKNVVRRILDEVKLYQETLAALYSQINRSLDEETEEEQEKRRKQEEARKSLIVLLERRLDGNLERIFRLLGLKYPSEDIINIYKGIRSKKEDMRINATEFLDNLLESNLKKILIPIIETAFLEGISKDAIENLNLKIPGEYKCFEMLLQGHDVKIKLAVLYLMGQTKDWKYIPMLQQYANSENVKVRNFAEKALAGMF